MVAYTFGNIIGFTGAQLSRGTIIKGHNGRNHGDKVNGSHLLIAEVDVAHTHARLHSRYLARTAGPQARTPALRGCLPPIHSPMSLPPDGCICMWLPLTRSAEVQSCPMRHRDLGCCNNPSHARPEVPHSGTPSFISDMLINTTTKSY